jgi:hypothetical protein
MDLDPVMVALMRDLDPVVISMMSRQYAMTIV